MKSFLLIILSFLWLTSYSQTSSYKFSDQIDSMMLFDSVPWKYQRAAWDYSYISEYAAALKAMNDDYFIRLKPSVPSESQLKSILKERRKKLSTYKPIPAEEYIISEASKTSIVIINEAHHNPRHRIFVETLLTQLHSIGYRYLGIETLNYRDTLLNQRKYPLISSGTYLKEPHFGNLIRTALRNEYTVFPYEANGSSSSGKQREIEQAQNIKRVMDKNPNAKFIIYCGFDHAIEDSMSNSWGYAMAGRLKAITGINPLTIDQVQLTETGNSLTDNPYWQIINLDYSAVFIDKQGKAFSGAISSKTFDVNVYHPSTKMLDERPDWLQTKEKRAVEVISKIKLQCPCLIMAYEMGDDVNHAVPVDIIEVKNKSSLKKMILDRTKKHILIIRNKAGITERVEIN